MKPLRFFDPLYGRTDFSRFEWDIITSPEVQRLRYIRMCNINSLLISGASEISRFEHVLGVMRLAQEWTAANNILGIESEVVHAAALLHDFQTGPFGHSMEYILSDNSFEEFQHEDVAGGAQQQFSQTIRQNAAFAGAQFATPRLLAPLWAKITEAIRGDGKFGPLISGIMDLDNIDNVVRLAMHSGVASKGDSDICLGLARDLQIMGRGLSITSSNFDLVFRWQRIRTALYRLLLHDWAEFSAKAMLTTMIEFAVESGLLGPDNWVLTDDALLSLLTKHAIGENQRIAEIGGRLIRGDLYEPLAMWRSPSVDGYERISKISYKRTVESEIKRHLKCHCIFHTILDSRKVSRKVTLFDRTTRKPIDFGTDSRELLIGVFAARSDHPQRRTALALSELAANLSRDGIVDLSDLPDPLPPPADQLRLFS